MRNPAARRLAAILSAALFMVCHSALADTVSWDRAENAGQAGRALAEMWAKQGALGIFKHIEACHEEHVIQATEYTREAEACLVQDVIHSRVSAQMYSGLSEASRKMSGSPTAETVLLAMNSRLMATGRKFKFSREEIRKIATEGFEAGAPAYFKALKEQMAAAQKRRAGK